MSEIDPKNLGEPVYKEDQVITQSDLEYLIGIYKNLEKAYVAVGNENNMRNACAAHSVCEALQAWIQQGKPRSGEMDDEYYQ